MSEIYDYIVVGSGAAGSTLAYRLAQQQNATVLVLEHGGGLGNPMHRIPKGFFFTLRGDTYVHHYETEPIAGTDKRESWTRGKVVGGSTTVNGMMWNRGFAPDYDELAAHTGDEVWNWASFLSAFRAMEDHNLGYSPYRGVGGRLGVSVPDLPGELTERIFAAGRSFGLDVVDDVNASDGERIGFTASTIKHGRRTSAATAYLLPALRRENVSLETRTWVAEVIIEGGRALGVRGSRRGQPVEFRARRDVIIAAGTVETPLLLERSGIGRPEVLKAAGVAVKVEAPNVGERVIEQHGGAAVQVRLARGLGSTLELNSTLKQGLSGAKYLLTGAGPISTASYDYTFHVKSSPELERPDLVGIFSLVAIDPTKPGMAVADHAGLGASVYETRPQTQGAIHLSGTAEADAPVISPRYFETDRDRKAAALSLGRLRELLGQAALAEVSRGEDYPTEAVSSDPESAFEYAKQFGATIYHAVGSAGMGQRDDDVVDARLRVRGVDGLRVVDASVFPFQTAGNTAAPVMALGWIAGGFLRAE